MEVTSTPAESSFFRALSLLKLYTGLQYHIDSDFRQTSKNFEEGLPKHILEKNTVFWKRVSKYGRLTVLVLIKGNKWRADLHTSRTEIYIISNLLQKDAKVPLQMVIKGTFTFVFGNSWIVPLTIPAKNIVIFCGESSSQSDSPCRGKPESLQNVKKKFVSLSRK